MPNTQEYGNQKMSRRLSLIAILLTFTFVALAGCGQDKNAETIETGSNTSAIEHGNDADRSGSAPNEKVARESKSAENNGNGEEKSTPSAPATSSDVSSSSKSANPSHNPFEAAGIQDPKAF